MKNRRLKDSFTNAFRGIKQAFITENNIKIHTLAAIISIFLGIFFKLEIWEWMMIVIAITLVFVAELLNTAVEYAIDMVCGDRYDEIAKYAKDISAGATLIAAVGALIIGFLVFVPKALYILLNI